MTTIASGSMTPEELYWAGAHDHRDGENVCCKPPDWTEVQWDSYVRGLAEHPDLPVAVSANLSQVEPLWHATGAVGRQPEKWGLVVEEQGTGGQCVPDFSGGSAALSENARLREIIHDYAEHIAWRCLYQGRYPWDPDCHCGLTKALREAGLPVEWAARRDPEAKDAD